MLDIDANVVELCARCMADAAAHDNDQRDLALSAAALARDIDDLHCADVAALLDGALRAAVAYVEVLELDNRAFASALRRLASLRARVARRLAVLPRAA